MKKYVVYFDKISRQYEVGVDQLLKMTGISTGFIFDTGSKTYCSKIVEKLNSELMRVRK